MELRRLLDYARSPQPVARALAARGLRLVEPLASEAIVALSDLALDDTNRLVREAARLSLMDLGLVDSAQHWCAQTYDPQALAEALTGLCDEALPEQLAKLDVIIANPHASALDAVVTLLAQTSDAEVIRRALDAAAKIGHFDAVSAVARHLSNPEPHVGLRAAQTLGRIGSPAAVASLEAVLATPTADVDLQVAVARAFETLASEEAVPALVRSMVDRERATRVRRSCGNTLCLLEKATIPVGAACYALTDPDPNVRRHAANLLRRTPDRNAYSALVDTITARDPLLVSEAVESLAHIAVKLAEDRDAKFTIADLAGAVRHLLGNDNASVRRSGLRALGDARVSSDIDALAHHAFQAADQDERFEACKSLARFGVDVCAELIEGLPSLPLPDTRQSAGLLMGKLGDRRFARALLALAADPVPKVREAAVRGLVSVSPDDALDAAKRASDDKEAIAVQLAALHALGTVGRNDSTACAILCRGLRSGILDVRWRAASALAQLGNRDAIHELQAALRVNDGIVARAIVVALGQLGANCAPDLVLLLAHDPDEDLRRRAAEALGFMHGELAVAALVLATRDRAGPVRRATAHALRRNASHQAAVPTDLGRQDALARLIRDPQRSVRQAAVRAMGELDRGQGCRSLIVALADVAPEVQMEACKMLGVGGDEEALYPLRLLTMHPNPAVQAAATAALGELRLRLGR